MMPIQTRITVMISPEWQATKDIVASLSVKGFSTRGRGYPTLVSFYEKDVKKAGQEAVKRLREVLNQKIYSKPAYPYLENGKLIRTRSRSLWDAARIIGPEATFNRIEMGIFDKRIARGMSAHVGDRPYYDILEYGHKPYELSQKQLIGYLMILKELKQYDSAVSKQFSGIRGNAEKTGIGLGIVHPGIPPYRFFRAAIQVLNKRILEYGHTVFQRYKSYLKPSYKPVYLEGGPSMGHKYWYYI